jgi:glutaredoxin
MRIPLFGRSSVAPSLASGPDPSIADEGAPRIEPVVVYGGDWCGDCHAVTRFLDREQVPYRWVDLGQDAAAQERLSAAGYRAIPVVVLPDGRTLVEPSTRQLADALGIGPT